MSGEITPVSSAGRVAFVPNVLFTGLDLEGDEQ